LDQIGISSLPKTIHQTDAKTQRVLIGFFHRHPDAQIPPTLRRTLLIPFRTSNHLKCLHTAVVATAPAAAAVADTPAAVMIAAVEAILTVIRLMGMFQHFLLPRVVAFNSPLGGGRHSPSQFTPFSWLV
jgi:hypothetical protein